MVSELLLLSEVGRDDAACCGRQAAAALRKQRKGSNFGREEQAAFAMSFEYFFPYP